MAPTITINGKSESVADLDPATTLLQYLRASGRTGTKEGCAEGDCGACTVALAAGPAGYRAVNSCLLPLGSAAGRAFVTVEGVAPDRGRLHPVQEALVAEGGSQCGYCTPGFVMSMFAAYYDGAYAAGAHGRDTADRAAAGRDGVEQHAAGRNHAPARSAAAPSGDEIVEGNLCRCTGYLPIRRAAARLGAPAPDDPHLHALAPHGGGGAAPPESRDGAEDPAGHGTGTGDSVRHGSGIGGSAREGHGPGDGTHPWRAGRGPASGRTRFFAPRSLDDALALLAEDSEATPIAGGTDLGVDITKFHRRFPALVSLEHVPELHALEEDGDELRIGAAVPLSRIEESLHGRIPALDEMLRWFAARQIRNRATLGGNLGTASPIGDLAPVLLALDARIDLASRGGRRTVAVADFFHAYRETERRPDELIEAVRIPRRPEAGGTFRHAQSYKVGKRGTDDISIVAACFRVDLDGRDRILRARLAYGGVAAVPVRARGVERSLEGRAWTEATVREAARALRDAFTPLDDHRGSAAYRRKLAGNLFEKFWHEHRHEQRGGA